MTLDTAILGDKISLVNVTDYILSGIPLSTFKNLWDIWNEVALKLTNAGSLVPKVRSDRYGFHESFSKNVIFPLGPRFCLGDESFDEIFTAQKNSPIPMYRAILQKLKALSGNLPM